VWENAGKVRLKDDDQEGGIEGQGPALAGARTKAPVGGEAPGPSAGDRATSGTTRRVLTERRGAPWALGVTGAHPPDKPGALETVESRGVPRPERSVERWPQLCLDNGSE
jgi:putative transposase